LAIDVRTFSSLQWRENCTLSFRFFKITIFWDLKMFLNKIRPLFPALSKVAMNVLFTASHQRQAPAVTHSVPRAAHKMRQISLSPSLYGEKTQEKK
jgi:hypothetical protein